ncbi:MAG TPA: chemotaxis protein CheW [Labilithrix sp.]|jgi:purine-binding chemotaxis protein CheW|nr:chemotaxis protein CheW [Labilithrix sp.]
METASRVSNSRSAEAAQSRGLCTFWLGGRQFGLEVGLVAEIVTVEAVLPVPRAPRAIRGLFNLRGTPIALLDCAEVLSFGDQASSKAESTALVIRQDDVLVALVVDRMEAVLPPGRGVSTQPTPEDHPAVGSFLTLEDAPADSVVTVIDTAYLRDRLEGIRFTKEVD